ncbi:hypothetical protein, partial [Verrucomicrobium sp. BvORR106]|uniref:hypothetical protein n=1 Tax=Verrucomicrobium sp. BvORR106 TaxID=1403819 RepID=UPI00224102AF
MNARNVKIALVVCGGVLSVGAMVLTMWHPRDGQTTLSDGARKPVPDGGRRPGVGGVADRDANDRGVEGQAAFPARASASGSTSGSRS